MTAVEGTAYSLDGPAMIQLIASGGSSALQIYQVAEGEHTATASGCWTEG